MRLDLPCPRYRPGGLAGAADAGEQELMRAALASGMVLVPAEAFAHGMLLAFSLLEVMSKIICRVGEAQQILYGANGWVEREINGETWMLFLCVPKAHIDPVEIPLDVEGVVLLTRLKRFVRERRSIEGAMPVMAPARSLRAKVEPGDFVFSHAGRALEDGALNYLLKVLLAGLCPITTHLIRHAAATAADRSGLKDRPLARVMNYKGQGLGEVRRYTGDLGERRREDAAWYNTQIASSDVLDRDEEETR